VPAPAEPTLQRCSGDLLEEEVDLSDTRQVRGKKSFGVGLQLSIFVNGDAYCDVALGTPDAVTDTARGSTCF
jgi:hypothetical protein